MDSAFSTMGFVIFGFTFSMYAFLVESRLSPSPSPSPPPPSPPPPSLSLAPQRPDSPRQWHRASKNPEPKAKRSPPNRIHHHHRLSPPPPPPPPAHQMNGGKKIGLLFAGIAAIMQIGVVGFLVYKRSQLLKTNDLFETGS